MAVSAVSICNRALQRLSASRITSLTQDHPNARNCNVAYDPVRRALLRAYAWNFAKKEASVAVDATTTTIDSLNRYLLPNDYIRLIRDPDNRVDWQVRGRYIITADSSPLQYWYVRDEDDPGVFDPLFAEAFGCKIAYEICEAVTGSLDKRKLLRVDYKEIIADARQMNAFERDADQLLEDDFILAMY